MKKIIIAFAVLIILKDASAQVNMQDYQPVLAKFRQWYNAGEPDSLYTLLSTDVTQVLESSVWNQVITNQMRKAIPSIDTFIFDDTTKGSAVFKGINQNSPLCVQLSVNKNFLVNGIYIREKTMVPKARRPQTPVPPFAYNSEDVEFDNADKSVHFGGTFTYPKEGASFTTALLLTGSGQQDRDETILGHKPFAVIADYLTKLGIAVFRVDDRGKGITTGLNNSVTSEDFAKDAEAALAYLGTRKEVDKNKIGLIGHSEGALIADIVASRNKDISFVVMLAGPGIKGDKLLAEQNAAILEANGISKETAAAYTLLYMNMIDSGVTAINVSDAFEKITACITNWKKDKSKSLLDALKLAGDSSAQQLASQLSPLFVLPWMKYFVSTDPKIFIEKFHAKVLALNGSKDVQVIASSNLAGIKDALAQSKSKDYEVKELPGLNHLFQHCNKCTIDEYGELEETFSPDALDIIGKWIQSELVNKK